MDKNHWKQAEEWADERAPYPKYAAWEVSTFAGFATAIVLSTFCELAEVPERRGLPVMALFVAIASAVAYFEVRGRARRHHEAYLEALQTLEKDAGA